MTAIHEIDIDDALDDVLEHDTHPAEATTAESDPYITALSVDVLFADHSYQRELDEIRVQKMAAAFQIALVGIIEVSERPDGRYAILDGQHRWATVRDVTFAKVGPSHVAVRVHMGLTIAEEAALYHQLNTTRRQLTGWDRWLARRGAGDPQVAAIEECLARHQLIVSMRGGGNVFRSTRAAEHVVDIGGINLLDQVIGTIRAAYPDDQAGLDGSIVHGLGHVLDNYSREELDLERLITALAGIMPRQLTARGAAARELHKGTLDRLVGHAIVDRYNASKGPRLEAFFTRVKPISKTKTTKAKAEAKYREEAMAWAKTSPDWTGRLNRLTPALRAAYDAHLGSTSDRGGYEDNVDDAMVARIVSGQPRPRKPTRAECQMAYDALRRRGVSTFEIERTYGLNSERYSGANR
jgi:hypothetical protein